MRNKIEWQQLWSVGGLGLNKKKLIVGIYIYIDEDLDDSHVSKDVLKRVKWPSTKVGLK